MLLPELVGDLLLLDLCPSGDVIADLPEFVDEAIGMSLQRRRQRRVMRQCGQHVAQHRVQLLQEGRRFGAM